MQNPYHRQLVLPGVSAFNIAVDEPVVKETANAVAECVTALQLGGSWDGLPGFNCDYTF